MQAHWNWTADRSALRVSIKCSILRSRTTKAEIIDYYVRVAPFLLPHLKDRPVTLKRYPDGVTAQAYWDKDIPNFAPNWVRTFPVPRHAGGPDINYIVIQDSATPAWTAQIAALELHPFLHCVPRIDIPTWLVFDLDPGEPADILNCIDVAILLRDVLARLERKRPARDVLTY